MFDNIDFDQHERVVFVNRPEAGLRAIIAIHSLALGSALGGCRMRPYETSDAALSDALKLSKAMSYKNALGDRPFGGAKAVIIGDPNIDKSAELLRAFGEAVQAAGGDYVTAEDAGINPMDIKAISERTAFTRNIAEERGGPAPYTAYGIYIAIKAALDQVSSRGVKGSSISVQGLGGVGLDLAARLHADGARLLVSDIDAKKAELAAREFGAEVVASGDAHKQHVDLFAPCAFGGVLNSITVGEIQAPIVAGAANNQLASSVDDEELVRRGVVYCPDYVINAGGIRATEVQGVAFDHHAALRRVEDIETVLRSIIETARARRLPTGRVADEMARAKIARA